MGILDGPIRPLVGNIMAKFGTSCVIRSVTHGVYNATNGASPESYLDTALKGTISEYQTRELSDAVKVGDKKLTVAAINLAFVPDTEDRVMIDGTNYRVVRVTTTMATDEEALYEIQLRGSA